MSAAAKVIVMSAEDVAKLVDDAVDRAFERAGNASHVLTRVEAAEFLRVSPHAVAKLVLEKDLPGRKLGDEWRFIRTELAEWLARQPKEGAANGDR